MTIILPENSSSSIVFGLNRTSSTKITSPVSSRTFDVIKFTDGRVVTFSTNYFHGKQTDRLIKVFNKFGELIRTKFKFNSSK